MRSARIGGTEGEGAREAGRHVVGTEGTCRRTRGQSLGRDRLGTVRTARKAAGPAKSPASTHVGPLTTHRGHGFRARHPIARLSRERERRRGARQGGPRAGPRFGDGGKRTGRVAGAGGGKGEGGGSRGGRRGRAEDEKKRPR